MIYIAYPLMFHYTLLRWNAPQHIIIPHHQKN